jgi:hypothetical protein
MIVLLALFACAPAPSPVVVAPVADPLVPMDDVRLLRRLSLDLRGVLPSVEELDAVEADGAQVDIYRDQFLADPRLEGRLVALFAEQWHTLVDAFDVDVYDFDLTGEDAYRFQRSVGEEPLRLLAYVATHDRPWSEIVTADYTVANELLAGVWPLAYPEGGEGWEVSTYTDDRPAAGVLASNGLWWRYSTNPFNQNRTRAAAVFRLLVCEDFPARPVSFATATEGFEGVSSADRIQSDPYCLACHASIEPLASALFGFWWFRQNSPTEMVTYHAEREMLGADALNAEPAWFGEPVAGLEDLGRHVAADGRFSECAARTMATALWRRDTVLEDQPRIEALESAFVDGGMRMPVLLRDLTDTPEYRAGAVTDDAPEAVSAREVTVRLLGPEVLATVVEDLTGWRWEHGGYDQLGNDLFGYRMLMNGVDGVYITRPAQDPTLTWALVTARTAEASAYIAVQHDLVQGTSPRLLLQTVTATTPASDPVFQDELAALHWRLLARRATADDLAALTELWSTLYEADGSRETSVIVAWTGVLAALLQHPEFLSY